MSAAAETVTDLAPDLAEAERFLTLLDETADCFQFRAIRPDGVACKYSGALSDVTADLERENRAGAGIYVVVNETDGIGQKKSNIIRIRAIWQEDDKGDAPPPPLEPHMVVQSSPGKYHRYILTDGAPLDEFEPMQRRMVDDYGSDPGAKDRARVLRLPGFSHMKDPASPHMVRIIHESGAQAFDWQTVKAHIPPVDMTPRRQAPAPGSVDTAELERILSFIPNDDAHYAEFLKVGMALHHETGGDPAGFALWLDWSAKSNKHNETEMRKKFESFGEHDSVVTIGTLIWLAKKNGYKPAATASASKLAERLANQLRERLYAELRIDSEESPETADSLQVDATAIDRMLNRAFWSGSKSKMFILNDSNSVNQYTEKDAWAYLSRACGAVANREAIVSRVMILMNPLSASAEREAQKEANRIAAIPRNVILHELKWRNQRDHIQWRVDMFVLSPHLELKEDAARITLPHIPFPDHGKPDPHIIVDYKEHFPEFDEVLRMIVAARFAGDRKRAYLWLLASSDWGKGFFTACLAELGLVVEMSVKEIERVFEGSPAGKRPEEFKRAWVLAVNEFKSVRSEIKQLESHMQIAPKNQLTSEVELFAKLFMSAENVASLITDHGVEDQFAQRFSLIDKRGAIDDRPLFRQDSGAYRRAVVAYMSQAINQRVREYKALGREESDRQGIAVLRDFHENHGLANFATRFSESMADVAEEFSAWLRHEATLSPNWYRDTTTGRLYLRNATKELEDFLHSRKPSDQVGTIKRRKDDIFAFVSDDGRGYASHKINGRSFKGVRVE